MKKFILPVFTAFAILALFQVSSCDKCPDPDNPDCDPDTTVEDTTDDNINTGVRGNLTIIVRRKGNAKPVNNDKSYAVLGKDRDQMVWFDYSMNANTKRPKMDDAEANFEEFDLLDVYSTPDQADLDGKSASTLHFDQILVGTYYLHVLDGGLNKSVQSVAVTEATGDDTIVVETEPLGHLEIITAQSSIAQTELDSIEWRMYGTSNDTFVQVAKAKPSEIQIEPYFQGRTSTQTNERGQEQTGIYFLTDIPAGREYMVICYSSSFANKDGQQPNKIVQIRKNNWTKVRLNFTD